MPIRDIFFLVPRREDLLKKSVIQTFLCIYYLSELLVHNFSNSMNWKTDLGISVHLVSNTKEVQRSNGQEKIKS